MPANGAKNGYYAAPSNPAAAQGSSWSALNEEQRTGYIEKYSPLIKYVGDRLASRLPAHISKDDLISAGILGLIDAVDKFDPGRKILFKTYAEFRIKGAMLDELRSMDWVPRSVRQKSSMVEKAYLTLEAELNRPASDEEVAEYLGMPVEDFLRLLDEIKGVSLVDFDAFRHAALGQNRSDLFDLIVDENTQNALAVLGLSEVRSVVAAAVNGLPEKERFVVSMYYYDELTMKEIGEVLGYTESRISQLHTKSLIRLKSRLRRYFDEKGA